MAEFGFELEDIARLVKMVEANSLSELVVEEDGVRVVVKGAVQPKPHHALAGDASAGYLPAPTAAPAPVVDKGMAIESPVVGVFYRSAGPDQPTFIEVGDHVAVDQTVGLIEAMKVFSEVKSDHAGTVLAIPAENGKLVKVGQALVYIKPD